MVFLELVFIIFIYFSRFSSSYLLCTLWKEGDMSIESFLEKHTHTVKYQKIYNFEYGYYQLSPAEYDLRVYVAYENEDDNYSLSFYPHINNLFKKVVVFTEFHR